MKYALPAFLGLVGLAILAPVVVVGLISDTSRHDPWDGWDYDADDDFYDDTLYDEDGRLWDPWDHSTTDGLPPRLP